MDYAINDSVLDLDVKCPGILDRSGPKIRPPDLVPRFKSKFVQH